MNRSPSSPRFPWPLRTLRYLLILVSGAAALLAWLAPVRMGEAQSDLAAAELAAFVSTLTQDHIHLFEPADRATLTEMLRWVRELERAAGRRPRPGPRVRGR